MPRTLKTEPSRCGLGAFHLGSHTDRWVGSGIAPGAALGGSGGTAALLGPRSHGAHTHTGLTLTRGSYSHGAHTHRAHTHRAHSLRELTHMRSSHTDTHAAHTHSCLPPARPAALGAPGGGGAAPLRARPRCRRRPGLAAEA